MYAYEKLIQEHTLNISSLPKDAQSGIADIKKLQRVILMNQKSGKDISQTQAKARTLDKWVTREILEHLEEVEEQNIEKPITSEEVQEIVEEMNAEPNQTDPNVILGQKIDAELTALASNNPGISEFNIDEIVGKIPATHKQIFEHYEDGGQNGVRTPIWAFVEIENAKFTLKKR